VSVRACVSLCVPVLSQCACWYACSAPLCACFSVHMHGALSLSVSVPMQWPIKCAYAFPWSGPGSCCRPLCVVGMRSWSGCWTHPRTWRATATLPSAPRRPSSPFSVRAHAAHTPTPHRTHTDGVCVCMCVCTIPLLPLSLSLPPTHPPTLSLSLTLTMCDDVAAPARVQRF
jgi:hypothetical protein